LAPGRGGGFGIPVSTIERYVTSIPSSSPGDTSFPFWTGGVGIGCSLSGLPGLRTPLFFGDPGDLQWQKDRDVNVWTSFTMDRGSFSHHSCMDHSFTEKYLNHR
jgi:hypothetical protein